MSRLIERLKEIRDKLENPETRQSFLEEALSKDLASFDKVEELQELDVLTLAIIKASFNAGHRRTADLARAKAVANSDNQAGELAPIIREIKKEGTKSLQDIADALNQRNIKTKNGHIWYPATVRLLIQKIDRSNEVGRL